MWRCMSLCAPRADWPLLASRLRAPMPPTRRQLVGGADGASEGVSGDGGGDGGSRPSVKVVPRIKTDIRYDGSVKSFRFITPLRAVREYMLDFGDLEKLTKYTSRSPYSHNVRIELYNKADIESVAFAKHGGREALERMRERVVKQDLEERINLFNIKKALKKIQGLTPQEQELRQRYSRQMADRPRETVLQSKAGRIVLAAITINAANAAVKGIAWWFTGSRCMLSETVHSVADTLNQIILAVGLHQSLQRPDETHPYGYAPMRNVSSLISGVGIFFCGAVVSWYEGVHGLMGAEAPQNLYWALYILCGSLISEGATLLLAVNHARQEAARMRISLRHFVLGGYDPSTNVVLMEDLVAVCGVGTAAVCMSLTEWTGNAYPDAAGAVMIGCLLASVAAFIVRTNARALIGKSVPLHQRDAMMRVMERHKVVRGIYDCKATVLGSSVRLKAEVDIDGAVLTRRYLETQQTVKLLQEIKAIDTEEQALQFLMKHGENITNILGAEINDIEASIKKEFPEVKHIDIEIN